MGIIKNYLELKKAEYRAKRIKRGYEFAAGIILECCDARDAQEYLDRANDSGIRGAFEEGVRKAINGFTEAKSTIIHEVKSTIIREVLASK